MPLSENKQKMQRGDLYHAFTPELYAERTRCTHAINRFNDTRDTNRRHRVELWREIVQNEAPMPPLLENPDEDAAQFDATDPWVEPPLHADYGYNVDIAPGAFVNFNSTFIDTCRITIGARTLVAPSVSFYSGTHPLSPAIRQGTKGPEMGKEIHVGEDCWIGGNAIILPGITVGNGAVVGAGSVVTKDVAPFTVVAGNPARVIRKIET